MMSRSASGGQSNDRNTPIVKPAKIKAALDGAKGTVRKLPPKSGEKLSEVYWRPPAGYLDPQSLPAVLLARLTTGSGAA